MTPTLVISLINHSNPELLRDCLASVPAAVGSINTVVYVVDNASGGRLVDELKAEFPHAMWIHNDRRRGFGFNHNQVMSRVEGRYYCILNDDTVLHPGSLARLVKELERDARIGVVGPRLTYGDGSIQESAFREWTLVTEAIELPILPWPLSLFKRFRRHPAQDADRTTPVAWLLGACLVVRKAAIEKAGPFDAKGFPVANNEEVDWCRRIRLAGFKVMFVPAARVTHLGGQTLRQEPSGDIDWMLVESMRTRITYFRKHAGVVCETLARGLQLVASMWNLTMYAQTRLRGRSSRDAFIRNVRTTLCIASVALRGQRTPVGPYARYAD